jgi:hypothetical protein
MLKQHDHKRSYDRDELDYHTKMPKPRYERERTKLRPIDVEAILEDADTDEYQGVRIR